MRVLFLDAYFEPEQIAFTHLENDLLEGLVSAGHEVEIVCPTPTRGVTKEIVREYKKRKSEFLYDGHVHVTRFSSPQEGKHPIVRAIRYLWCNFRTYYIGKHVKDIDVVFANSTPPTQGWIAGKVAKKQKVPFVYSLQDIFPDSLINAGMTREGSLIWRIGRKIENETYRRADRIIVISRKCKDNLQNKAVSNDKISLINNWIDITKLKYIERGVNTLIEELGIDKDKYLVVYAGNMGEMQGVEVILKAARLLEKDKKLEFILFGAGARFDDIKDKAKSISNVRIFPLMRQDKVSEVYSLGDVSLITCKEGTGTAGLPSKLWSIMACETPIIASFDMDSDLNLILQDSNSGVCVPPNDEYALANAIKSAYEKKWFENTGIKSREYVSNNASKEICLKRYIDIFLNITRC